MNTETVLDGQLRAGRKLLDLMRELYGYPDWVTRILLEMTIHESQEAAKRLRAMGVPESDIEAMRRPTNKEKKS